MKILAAILLVIALAGCNNPKIIEETIPDYPDLSADLEAAQQENEILKNQVSALEEKVEEILQPRIYDLDPFPKKPCEIPDIIPVVQAREMMGSVALCQQALNKWESDVNSWKTRNRYQ